MLFVLVNTTKQLPVVLVFPKNWLLITLILPLFFSCDYIVLYSFLLTWKIATLPSLLCFLVGIPSYNFYTYTIFCCILEGCWAFVSTLHLKVFPGFLYFINFPWWLFKDMQLNSHLFIVYPAFLHLLIFRIIPLGSRKRPTVYNLSY